MCYADYSQNSLIIIIVIITLISIKQTFYSNTHLYEFIKVSIAIFLILFLLYLYIEIIKKFYCNNRIVPEENDIENNNIENNEEITVPPDGVHP